MEKACQRVEKATKAGGKEMLARKALLERVLAHLDNGAPVRSLPLSEEEQGWLRELHLLTAKPTLYIANVAEDGFDDNPLLEQVRALAQAEKAEVARSARRWKRRSHNWRKPIKPSSWRITVWRNPV